RGPHNAGTGAGGLRLGFPRGREGTPARGGGRAGQGPGTLLVQLLSRRRWPVRRGGRRCETHAGGGPPYADNKLPARVDSVSFTPLRRVDRTVSEDTGPGPERSFARPDARVGLRGDGEGHPNPRRPRRLQSSHGPRRGSLYGPRIRVRERFIGPPSRGDPGCRGAEAPEEGSVRGFCFDREHLLGARRQGASIRVAR